MHKTILSTILCLCLRAGAPALDLPALSQSAGEAPGEPGRRIAMVAADASRALGDRPAPRQILVIVFKSVRSSPESVLPIVAATVRVSPRTAVAEIVTGAIIGVPNPRKKVTYNRRAILKAINAAPDDENKPDGNGGRDTRPGAAARRANPVGAIEVTLAEAIVLAAFDAEPRLPFPELQAAADAAIRIDPATLMREVQSPAAAAGIRDGGPGSYGNEPLLPPTQPAVSR